MPFVAQNLGSGTGSGVGGETAGKERQRGRAKSTFLSDLHFVSCFEFLLLCYFQKYWRAPNNNGRFWGTQGRN